MAKNEIKQNSSNEIVDYSDAVRIIKTSILQSQYDAAKSANEKQLILYYGVGKYISENSRTGFWGTGAIDAISKRLQRELPGLRGFTARNLRNMRTFYEAWSGNNEIDASEDGISEIVISKMDERLPSVIWKLQFPNLDIENFMSIGFTHHSHILSKINIT